MYNTIKPFDGFCRGVLAFLHVSNIQYEKSIWYHINSSFDFIFSLHCMTDINAAEKQDR